MSDQVGRNAFDVPNSSESDSTGEKPRDWRRTIVKWLPLILPAGIIFYFWRRMSRKGGVMGSDILSIGKNKSRIVAEGETGVTFNDVAGADDAKAELEEIVDFLKSPDRYDEIGGRIPKGILLVGAPGTGKTLLARAVAGEAGVPFFRLSGADFVEMFVGVGASRVRDRQQRRARADPRAARGQCEVGLCGRHDSRGLGALGYTLQLPEEERLLLTRRELLGRIDVPSGGARGGGDRV